MPELSDLSPRQIAVASMVARGFSDKQIAVALRPTVSERQVRRYLQDLETLCQLDPTRNLRVQLAGWYRDRVTISLEMPPE
jgi:DNA-binding NarL/FixJ family response regulator